MWRSAYYDHIFVALLLSAVYCCRVSPSNTLILRPAFHQVWVLVAAYVGQDPIGCTNESHLIAFHPSGKHVPEPECLTVVS